METDLGAHGRGSDKEAIPRRNGFRESELPRRCRCSTGQEPIGHRVSLALPPMSLHENLSAVLNPPVGAHANSPCTDTLYSEVNDELGYIYHFCKLLLWDPSH